MTAAFFAVSKFIFIFHPAVLNSADCWVLRLELRGIRCTPVDWFGNADRIHGCPVSWARCWVA